MNARRARAQSLVELALVAPILILLAMSVWDGGSILREQVVLQQAARDGARVAATGYGTAVLDTVVANAVIASARDLPGLSSTPGYVAISYPDAQSVQVRVNYAHSLITPVLRQLWAGGSGTIALQASATFYLPRLTPVPATLVVPTPTSSPTPVPTPSATPSPAVTSTPSATSSVIPTATVTPTIPPTRTSTPTPIIITCQISVTIPQLNNQNNNGQGNNGNGGFYVVVQLNTPTYLDAKWTLPPGNTEDIQVLIYANTPTNYFAGKTNPVSIQPPAGSLVSGRGTTGSVDVRTSPNGSGTPQPDLTGSFTAYFYDLAGGLSVSSVGTLQYLSTQCP